MTESAEEVIECHGRIADHVAMTGARRGVQGVTLAGRQEVGQHSSRVGVHDGKLAIGMVPDEGRDHDVESTTAVQPLQSCPETSRQLLQAGIIDL